MHILLLSHYFPPEVNAPAIRGFDHACVWREAGHRVTVVTCTPSHPRGKPYPGYANRWTRRDRIAGIDVIRIWTWLAPNAGTMGRIASFASFFLSVLLHLPVLPKADVVVSTSPQFFCGLSGWLLQRRRTPWVLEIRDLWPDSIVAVGAMRRSPIIRVLEHLETWAYRRADRVVAVANGFVDHIARRRGRDGIIVVRNGVMADSLIAKAGDAELFRREHGLEGRFIATYLGTHGMAHNLDSVLDAAALLRDRTDIAFVLVGDGAEKDRLLQRKEELGLTNVVMLAQQPREAIPAIWAASDASLITLRRSETFQKVLPSKIFEALATGTPVILAVEGEARALLEQAEAGEAVPPEDPAALADAVQRLADNSDNRARYARNGRRWFAANGDRRKLALTMLDALERCR